MTINKFFKNIIKINILFLVVITFGVNSLVFAGQTDKIKVFFNDPPDSKNIDIELANFINSARESVYAHFYQINRQVVIDALINASKKLGSNKVKLITDEKYYLNKKFIPYYQMLEKAGIQVKTDAVSHKLSSGESHNKFCIVDNKKVWTGSYNPTDNNTIKDYNNALILESEDVAKIYTEEFNMMFNESKFGAAKSPVRSRHEIIIDGVKVKVYFSPADNVNGIIADHIKNAKKNISFVIFAFTDDEIENALISKHKEGISVLGICDNLSAGGRSSGYKTLVENGLNIKKDSNSQTQLHHKFIVFDYDSDTNAVVITGSHNYTKAANTKNDENIVIIYDKYYATLYYNEFAKLYGLPMVKLSTNDKK